MPKHQVVVWMRMQSAKILFVNALGNSPILMEHAKQVNLSST